MIAIIRMRGEAGTRRDVIDTFKMLRLKKIYSARLIEKTPVNIGMIRKIDNFAAWGEASAETEKILIKPMGLKPPKGGLKSKKLKYPRGNIGYCGDKINDLIKKMV
ncbi:MAG: uL30 family ribosomal protein [Candidatus Aenigmatarchaeota archaeon]